MASVSEALQTGWTQTVSAEGFSSINLVSGQNPTGPDLANVPDTVLEGFRALPPTGRAIALSQRIRDPFDDPTDSNGWWWV